MGRNPVQAPGTRAAALVILGTLALAASASAADVQVTAIEIAEEAVSTTEKVEYIPLGSFEGQPVSVGMTVAWGGELRCPEGGILVRLEAGTDDDGATAKADLVGPFRVAVDDPGEAALVIDLRAGKAYVESSSPTEVDAGETRTATNRTKYGVEITIEGGETKVTSSVFDGAVTCTWGGESRPVLAGEACAIDRAEPFRIDRYGDETVEQAARVFARLDVTQATLQGVEGAEDVYESLRQEHRKVLLAPDDTKARLDLMERQILMNNTGAAKYQLERLPTEFERDTDDWARKTIGRQALGDRTVAPQDVLDAVKHVNEKTEEGGSRFTGKPILDRIGERALEERKLNQAKAADLGGESGKAFELAKGAAERKAESGRKPDSADYIKLSALAGRAQKLEEATAFAQRAFALAPPAPERVELRDLTDAWRAFTRGDRRLPNATTPSREWLQLFLACRLTRVAVQGLRARAMVERPDARDLLAFARWLLESGGRSEEDRKKGKDLLGRAIRLNAKQKVLQKPELIEVMNLARKHR